jgi:uncharacterized damage-inducible protein DinB
MIKSTEENQTMLDTLERLFRFKAWADNELLNTLAKLGEDSEITELAIKALSHSHVVDRIFFAHLRGLDHVFTSANPAHLPTLHALSVDMRASDEEYLDYVLGLHRDRLHEVIDFTFTDGALGRMSREELLMHVIIHGVGHRGQVSAVMLLNGLPPAKDGLTTYLHTAEANERRRAA